MNQSNYLCLIYIVDRSIYLPKCMFYLARSLSLARKYSLQYFQRQKNGHSCLYYHAEVPAEDESLLGYYHP